MPTGAELFVQTLRTLGIRDIYTLVGDHLNDVLPVAVREGLRIIDMRHESGCTHAADAAARITRRPALSLVTGGPGHTNSLTGIATAQLAASPLIAVSGSRGSLAGDRGAFQDIVQVGMAAPVCKYAAETPAASQIPFYLARAYKEANSGRKGAVHLSIPVDVFGAHTETVAPAPQILPDPVCPPDAKAVSDAIALLRQAERPIVLAGSGVWWGDAGAELQAFIETTNLPLYTITMARGVVPDTHPLCFGYGDPALNKAVQTSFKEADVMLVLGKRVDYRMALGGPRLFSPHTKFIQVDIHGPELGLNRKLEVAICADVKATLRALAAEAGGTAWAPKPWLERLRALRRQWQEAVAEEARTESAPLHPAAFYAEFHKHLPEDLTYVWDGGDFVHWGRVMTPALYPGRWLRLGPLGTIGSALPNCVATKLHFPDRPVVMLTGDGSLGFYLAELDTLVRHRLPVVIVVGNDAGWGVERELQGGQDTVACELRRSRYDLVMQGLGGGGETIDTLDQIGPAVRRAFDAGVPYLLNVNIRGVRSPFTQWQVAAKKK
jgi:acetolactate synthase-1/2/3 large subunit